MALLDDVRDGVEVVESHMDHAQRLLLDLRYWSNHGGLGGHSDHVQALLSELELGARAAMRVAETAKGLGS